jgi:hypothetical protein
VSEVPEKGFFRAGGHPRRSRGRGIEVMLRGVGFAYRVHRVGSKLLRLMVRSAHQSWCVLNSVTCFSQFAGGFDGDTMRGFEAGRRYCNAW